MLARCQFNLLHLPTETFFKLRLLVVIFLFINSLIFVIDINKITKCFIHNFVFFTNNGSFLWHKNKKDTTDRDKEVGKDPSHWEKRLIKKNDLVLSKVINKLYFRDLLFHLDIERNSYYCVLSVSNQTYIGEDTR